MSIKPQLYIAGIICGVFIISSCASTRKAQYFADQRDSIINSSNIAPPSILQANDLLSININSLNPAATAIFNTPNMGSVTATTPTGSNLQAPGYLVNPEGVIQFPLLGDIKVAGKTTDQLRLDITQQLINKKLLIDPVVVIRQLNFKVSVLGEVGHPTVVSVSNEKISLLEALGLAGDITIYGRKDAVMIIREESGRKVIKRLDLNSKELFNSPYYYLKSNDVVYVEANRAKITNSAQSTQLLPIVLSGLSFLAIIVQVIVRK